MNVLTPTLVGPMLFVKYTTNDSCSGIATFDLVGIRFAGQTRRCTCGSARSTHT